MKTLFNGRNISVFMHKNIKSKIVLVTRWMCVGQCMHDGLCGPLCGGVCGGAGGGGGGGQVYVWVSVV